MSIYFIAYMDPEQQEIKALFKPYDEDGIGTISREDMRKILHNLGMELTNEETEAVIKEGDMEGVGDVDYVSVVKILKFGRYVQK